MTERKRDSAGAATSGSADAAASGSTDEAASGSTDKAASGSTVGAASGGSVGGKCPICGKATAHAVRPFCSRRCADIDLARWIAGGYVIAGGEADADEDGDEGFAKEAGRLDRGAAPDDEPR